MYEIMNPWYPTFSNEDEIGKARQNFLNSSTAMYKYDDLVALTFNRTVEVIIEYCSTFGGRTIFSPSLEIMWYGIPRVHHAP